jgi:hypothetical protein
MIRVTTEDLSGEQEPQVVEFDNDYLLTTAGSCYLHHIQTYANGTTILTIKRDLSEDHPEEFESPRKNFK